MRSAIVGVLLLGLAYPASAANWVHLGTSTSRTDFYLDVDSVRNQGSYVAAWEKRDATRDASVDFREAKALYYYNCSARTTALKQWIMYDAQGSVTASSTNPDYRLEWSEAIPETVSETFLNAVCSLKR